MTLKVSAVLSVVLVASALVALSTTVRAAPPSVPDSPDRPGRPTPEQAGVPDQIPPVLPPNVTSRPTTGPGGAESDEDLLKETAADLGEAPPASRPDLELLRWYGLRPQIEQAGVTFQGTLTADYSRASQGFNTRTDAFRHLLDARVNVDTQALVGLYGGTLSADFQQQNGRNGSTVVAGDVQGFNNLDSDGRTQLSELWYQQKFAADKLRVKFGKVDANSEFAFPQNAAGFLNSSFGHSPTILSMPTYPDPATSLNVFAYPTRHLYAGAGVYDGSHAQGLRTGSYGPKYFFTGNNGYFLIGEAGAQWAFENQTLPGRVAVGGWYDTGHFTNLNNTPRTGTGGEYAVVEQTLWHKKYYNPTDPQGVVAFLQYGHAYDTVSPIGDHAGGGVVWNGPLDTRPEDSVGAGVTYVRLATSPNTGFGGRDFELSAEGYYSLQVTKYLQVKPDVQYVIHPGYAAEHDAVVGTIRVTLAF